MPTPLVLPSLTSNEGILVRMFIAESKNPGYSGYDPDEVRRGFFAMKAVVDNRLRNNPGRFNAPGATTYTHIITAPGQWHGFTRDAQGNTQIARDIVNRIEDVMTKANTGSPGRYYQFVQNALEVAAADVNDPFRSLTSIGGVAVTGGAYGWRTEGSTSPGPNFVLIPKIPVPPFAVGGVLGGNQFYALRKVQAIQENPLSFLTGSRALLSAGIVLAGLSWVIARRNKHRDR